MKVSNTAARLKSIMADRNIRQVDILNAAKPFCQQYAVKLEKSDLSQYVNGKVEPGQEKLTILGLALGVSEAWLMGYDVSPSRENNHLVDLFESAGGSPILISKDSSSETLTNTDTQFLHKAENTIKIAGRDGSFIERTLTDEQVELLKAMLNQLPEVTDL